jgi:hypothetical protein
MKNKTFFILVALILTLPILNSCGQGFKASEDPVAASSAPSTSGGTTPPVPPGRTETPEWKALNIEGSVSGGSFDKTQTVSLDKVAKELIIRLPMTSNPFLDGAILDLPIARIPGARLSLDSLSRGGSALVLHLPLAYITAGIKTLPPERLPNGDPLPMIPDGELPSTAIELTKSHNINATIYLARTVVGIFVNTPFDPVLRLTLPIRNADRTRILGYFTTIPEKSDKSAGGFFISVALPEDWVRIIDDNL